MEIALVALYFAVLLLLCAYGLHRAHLVWLCWKFRRQAEPRLPEGGGFGDRDLPAITLQLPLYNEATVTARLLDAVAAIDYPADRLEVQVLDDSTDETRTIAQQKVAELRQKGLDIHYLRRPHRVGYKAGALDFGLARARGSLIAVFDADFIPQPGILRQIVGHFADPEVGMVQARWGHLNRDRNLLTAVQAMMLDGHHLVENRARAAAGLFFNFSGTGGMWRRDAIASAGGWQHDTLTEDLDLSYRAQLAGWKFIYRPDVVTPAELPEEMSALRAQQYRWAKGTVQTARKLLRVVFAAPVTPGQRVEACFHLLPHFAYPLMLLLSILLLPALLLMPATDLGSMLLVDLPLCAGATGSLFAFYVHAERAQGNSGWRAIVHLPALIALGAGMSPHLTRAVAGGLKSMAGEFVRTPKRGSRVGRYRQRTDLPWTEAFLAAVSLASFAVSVATAHWFAAPFALLFTLGYAYVFASVVMEQVGLRARLRAASLSAVEAGEAAVPSSAGGMARAA